MRNDARSTAVFTWESAQTYEARLAADPAFLGARLQQAAIDGDVAAQIGWAHMLLEGHGVARNPDAALRWFQLAARSGSAEAINMVGRCHELGWGTARNPRMAAHCYRTAGEEGHAWANFNLAMLMLAGEGVPYDRREALALLVRSARRGNAKAMNTIGQACEEGWRGPVKPMAARRWYLRAARRGCFRGAFNTARHFMADGDLDRTTGWLRRSIAVAPEAFCEEIGAYLAGHSEPRLREISALALDRVRRGTEAPA